MSDPLKDFTVQDVRGDGNCFYYAVLEGIKNALERAGDFTISNWLSLVIIKDENQKFNETMNQFLVRVFKKRLAEYVDKLVAETEEEDIVLYFYGGKRTKSYTKTVLKEFKSKLLQGFCWGTPKLLPLIEHYFQWEWVAEDIKGIKANFHVYSKEESRWNRNVRDNDDIILPLLSMFDEPLHIFLLFRNNNHFDLLIPKPNLQFVQLPSSKRRQRRRRSKTPFRGVVDLTESDSTLSNSDSESSKNDDDKNDEKENTKKSGICENCTVQLLKF